MSAKGLILPDRKRCQAEITVTPGARAEIVLGLESQGPIGAFRHGPQAAKRKYRREHAPIVIAKETRPGADGKRGAMSLCNHCQAQMVQQCGESFATCKSINGVVPVC